MSYHQPRIIALTMVKNEQDIIEPMIRHNAALLDALIILDNGSVDDTGRIAMALARELGNVVVTDSAQFGYTQGERMTRLLFAAQSSYFADFVLFLDADEFIGVTSRAALHAELGKIPASGFGAVTWHNYVLTDGNPIEDPPFGLTHRIADPAKPTMKSILRLDGTFRADLVIGRGNHAIGCANEPLPGILLPDLPLWHFPLRSEAQLTAKAVVGWLACLAANPNAAELKQSYHWQGMFRRIVDGSGFSGDDLRTLSLHYTDPHYVLGQPLPPDPPVVHDPPPIACQRRCSSGAFLDPLTLLARSWEQSLRAPRTLFAPHDVAHGSIDIPPFRFLVEKQRTASVLELGCETGLDLELFARLGVAERTGIGTQPKGGLLFQHASYIRHDPAMPFTLNRTYALVLCLNTAADQSPSDPAALIANADRHAEGTILFSLDDPAAPHLDDWLAGWRRFGWVPDLMETLALRCLASAAPLRRGLVILGRASVITDGAAALLAIARRPYRQPPPCPGVHEEPLLDPAEASWLAFAA